MPADSGVYASERLARAYASTRPPVHPLIVDRALNEAGITRVPDALDVGSGGGASTAALLPYAARVVGVDPSAAMVTHASAAVPRATFRQGSAEHLPFDAASFDIVTSAGAINYSDVPRALAETARVLRRGGVLLLYDFSTGRIDDEKFAEAMASFHEVCPPPHGYALDLAALPFERACLRRQAHERFPVRLVMPRDAYVDYLLGETGVESAMTRGALHIEGARALVTRIVAPLFDGEGNGRREVIFDCEFVLATA